MLVLFLLYTTLHPGTCQNYFLLSKQNENEMCYFYTSCLKSFTYDYTSGSPMKESK